MIKRRMAHEFLNLCIVCKEDVLQTDNKFMIALESPYLNLYVHLSCYKEIEGTLKEFLNENLEGFILKSK